jgi:hypothetical protein
MIVDITTTCTKWEHISWTLNLPSHIQQKKHPLATLAAAPLLVHRNRQLYYRNYARQYFANWNTESDPEVIQQLHAKARQDATWVLDKVRRQLAGWVGRREGVSATTERA